MSPLGLPPRSSGRSGTCLECPSSLWNVFMMLQDGPGRPWDAPNNPGAFYCGPPRILLELSSTYLDVSRPGRSTRLLNMSRTLRDGLGRVCDDLGSFGMSPKPAAGDRNALKSPRMPLRCVLGRRDTLRQNACGRKPMNEKASAECAKR